MQPEEFKLSGEEPAKPKRSRKMPIAEAKDIDAAILAYNAAAKLYGFACIESRTPQRMDRLGRRLKDIGGIDNFKLALSAIPQSDFLMGRVIPKGWTSAFRLDFDRLLSTESGLGDVLAKLLDKAASTGTDLVGPNGKRWGWWKEKERELRALPADVWRQLLDQARPNGTWPWWVLTAPPGDPECLVHPDVVRERGLIEIYRGKISHD